MSYQLAQDGALLRVLGQLMASHPQVVRVLNMMEDCLEAPRIVNTACPDLTFATALRAAHSTAL